MPTDDIVALLVAERDKLTRAIEALQGPTARRGRPPKNGSVTANASGTSQAAPRKTRTFTAAQRKEQAERMRKYWAAKRAGHKPAKKPL